MPKSFTLLLRYLCIVVPCVTGLLLPLSTGEPFDYGIYLFGALLFAGLAELRLFFLNTKLGALCYMAEVGTAAWMLHQYGGIIGILFTSAVISLSNQLNRFPYFIISTVTWLIMNIIFFVQLPLDPIELAICNLFFITVALFKYVNINDEQERRIYIARNDELRGQTYDLTEARQEILRYAKMVEQFAQDEERNRIAHDLHDELGHRIIRLKLMMDAAIEVSHASPEQASVLYEQVRDQLASVMDTMRSTVQRLKPQDIHLRAYSLEQLMKEYEHSNIILRYQVEGNPFSLYPSAEIAIYRNAQEAITNAIRHGQATEIVIVLRYEVDHIQLQVTNNGSIPDHIRTTGLGITGMKDRAAALGGSVTVDCQHEFQICTVLPVQVGSAI